MLEDYLDNTIETVRDPPSADRTPRTPSWRPRAGGRTRARQSDADP
jgi:hypothetical protein